MGCTCPAPHGPECLPGGLPRAFPLLPSYLQQLTGCSFLNLITNVPQAPRQSPPWSQRCKCLDWETSPFQMSEMSVHRRGTWASPDLINTSLVSKSPVHRGPRGRAPTSFMAISSPVSTLMQVYTFPYCPSPVNRDRGAALSHQGQATLTHSNV